MADLNSTAEEERRLFRRDLPPDRSVGATEGSATDCRRYTRYVAGFMFDEGLERVALICKAKPEWQRGKLNAIGGKIEEEEGAVCAMVREFLEETGCQTTIGQWTHFLWMGDSETWRVEFFATTGDLALLRTNEPAEPVEIVPVLEVSRRKTIENLPWLVPLAVDFLTDGRPRLVEVRYPATAVVTVGGLHPG